MNGDRPKALIIGIGNKYGGDDAAGLAVAERLRGKVPPHIAVSEQSGEGTALVEAWKAFEFVILVDAIRSGSAPGTIRRFDVQKQIVPGELFSHSTHAFGVLGAIELSRALKELPLHLIIYGIEGQNFSASQKMSAPVEKAVDQCADQVLIDAQGPNQHDISEHSSQLTSGNSTADLRLPRRKL